MFIRKCLFMLFATLISTALWAVPVINKPAPDFTVIDVDGKTHSLKDFKGKIVVLEWTNHECPFVRKHYLSTNIPNLQKKYTKKDVVWLTVISSAPGKQGHLSADGAKEIVDKRQASPTTVILDKDGTLGKLYDAKATPHMYVIDKEGTLVYQGAIDSIRSADPSDIPKATNYIEQTLEALLNDKDIKLQETKAYGCSVKY